MATNKCFFILGYVYCCYLFVISSAEKEPVEDEIIKTDSVTQSPSVSLLFSIKISMHLGLRAYSPILLGLTMLF